jgi:hypothetical protein
VYWLRRVQASVRVYFVPVILYLFAQTAVLLRVS